MSAQSSMRLVNGDELKTRSAESVSRNDATMTYRGRSNEDISYAAALGRKNFNGQSKFPPPTPPAAGDFARPLDFGDCPVVGAVVGKNGTGNPTLGSKVDNPAPATKLKLPPNAFGNSSDLGKKDVGVMYQTKKSPIVATQVNKTFRSQGTNTEPLASDQKKDQAVSAKLCSCCDGVSSQAPVEFCGDRFNFQTTVAMSVANLGISFVDLDQNIDLNGFSNV